jgi:hypothetical protein
MKQIIIYTRDIKPNTDYMHDTQGRYDLLGQILATGYQIHIPMKTRTPQDLGTAIHPFTLSPRKYTLCNSPVTLAILKNNHLTGKQQLEAANKLLAPYDIVLVSDFENNKAEKEVEVAKSNIAIEEKTVINAKLIAKASARLSQYTCQCGSTSSVAELISDVECLICPYCNDDVEPELYYRIKTLRNM